MPYKDPEKKNAWMREKRAEEKRLADRENVLDNLIKFRVRDEAQDYFPGEISTCEDLWKIFNGIDPKNDPDKKTKTIPDIISPAYLKFKDRELTFEEWIEQRRLHRSDLWLLMQTVGRGRWSTQAHKPLADFFVHKDNSALKPDYTQSEMQAVLFAQDTQHARLLLYPRANRKSTVNLIDALQWIINFPDIVILICTNIKSLGKAFIKELRKYFTVSDYKRPSNFQILFPEYCIPADKGKKSGDVRQFWCPMAKLGLKDPTASFTSMEAGTAGVRADVIKFDDAVDDVNYKTAELRIAVREKFDAILELLVGNTGFWDAVGTRYTDGKENDTPEGREPDLYGTILNRYEGSDQLKTLIASAWTVLPDYQLIPLKQLERHMVTLLYPTLPCICGKEDNAENAVKCECGKFLEQSPGNFDSLMGKCQKNETWFRCQQLNEPAAPIKKDDDYINTFTEDNIRAAIEDVSMAPKQFIDKCLFIDTALTANRRSDWSAYAATGIEDRGFKKHPIVHYLEIRFVKAADLTLAQHVAELMAKYDCRAMIEDLEQFNNPNSSHANFKDEVRRQLAIRGINHQVIWFKPENKLGAKEARIRNLQRLHERGLLRFVMGTGNWLDEMKFQLLNYNGDKKLHSSSRTSRKDDIPDVMSQVYKILPYDPESETEDQAKERERQNDRDQMRREYERIYGTAMMSRPLNPDAQVEETRPITPIHDALSVLNHRSGPTVSFSRPKKE